jgi:hypothetical protein
MSNNNISSLENDFSYPIPQTENPDDDYEKLLEKDIESSCNFSVYINKLELNEDLTDEELLSKSKEEIIKYKNDNILKLKAYIASLEQEKEDLIDNFKETTSLLLEKLKDYETNKNNNNNNNNINNNNNNNINNNNNNIINEDSKNNIINNKIFERPGTATVTKDLKKKSSSQNKKYQRCPNCQKEILENEFVQHSLQCLRHTVHCKKCGELVDESLFKSHLNKYRDPNQILLSIKNNNFDYINMSIEHGFKINEIIEKNSGNSILHLICKENRNKILKNLLDKKIKDINLNILNNQKETPLITAINNKSIECAEILLTKNVNIKLRNKSDLSPLMLCCKFGYENLAKLIINKGGDVNEKNILGESPLSLAQINHHDELSMFLLKKQIKFK